MLSSCRPRVHALPGQRDRKTEAALMGVVARGASTYVTYTYLLGLGGNHAFPLSVAFKYLNAWSLRHW